MTTSDTATSVSTSVKPVSLFMAQVWRNRSVITSRNRPLYEPSSEEFCPLQRVAHFLDNGPENKTQAKKNRRNKAPVVEEFAVSDSDWRFDSGMWIVTLNLKVFKTIIKN